MPHTTGRTTGLYRPPTGKPVRRKPKAKLAGLTSLRKSPTGTTRPPGPFVPPRFGPVAPGRPAPTTPRRVRKMGKAIRKAGKAKKRQNRTTTRRR